jgi:hypothetical protein
MQRVGRQARLADLGGLSTRLAAWEFGSSSFRAMRPRGVEAGVEASVLQVILAPRTVRCPVPVFNDV